ncbi:hypothetical protein IMSAGC005_03683 [Lachnospiraceae bacterium]|nr:hypothetical protein IMSAGC005_03683 [Lachnospiraceae bacterium]
MLISLPQKNKRKKRRDKNEQKIADFMYDFAVRCTLYIGMHADFHFGIGSRFKGSGGAVRKIRGRGTGGSRRRAEGRARGKKA